MNPNHDVWGAHTNSNLLILFCWFSLLLFIYRVLCYFYIQPGSTKVKLWHIQQKNFKRLVTAEKHVNYHLLDANIYFSHFVCLLLNWGIFLPQISCPATNLFPLDLPSEPWREVVFNVSLIQEVSVISTNTSHPSFGKWQLLETAAGRQKDLTSKHMFSIRSWLLVLILWISSSEICGPSVLQNPHLRKHLPPLV